MRPCSVGWLAVHSPQLQTYAVWQVAACYTRRAFFFAAAQLCLLLGQPLCNKALQPDLQFRLLQLSQPRSDWQGTRQCTLQAHATPGTHLQAACGPLHERCKWK